MIPDFVCIDCRVDTKAIDEYYMVHHTLWIEAVGRAGMLCVGCLERRLGRELIANDFILDAPVNTPTDKHPKSERLRHRLGTTV